VLTAVQLGGHTPAEGRLASLICDRFPAMDLVRFANSGTEANMIAICTAMRYTGCSKIVVFEGGYHGSLLSHFRMDELNAGPSSALTAPFVRSTSRRYRRLQLTR
jgi:glutamate-1-semialdehyde 2,1-aminomutase